MNSNTHPAGTRIVMVAGGSRATINGWRGNSVSLTWDKGGTSYAPVQNFGRAVTEAEYEAMIAKEDAAWDAEANQVARRIADEEREALDEWEAHDRAEIDAQRAEYREEQRAELEAEQNAQTIADLAHTHTVSSINLREGDRIVGASWNGREVKTAEQNMNNLGAVLIRFTDGGHHHASTSDAWTINRVQNYQAPTHHPGRCYCSRVAFGGHIPGVRPWGYYEKQCQGDAHEPHDPQQCPACIAGATDLVI